MAEQFAQVPVALLTDPNLSDGAVRLWAILSGRYADYSTGEAYPSRTTLAGLLGVSVRSVSRYVNQLEQAGWLTVEHRKTAAGDWAPNLYRLATLSTGRDTSALPRDTSGMRVGTPVAHKPYPNNDTKQRPVDKHDNAVQRTLAMLNSERNRHRTARR
jgi:DNA-binding transcriptional MocR family regulator